MPKIRGLAVTPANSSANSIFVSRPCHGTVTDCASPQPIRAQSLGVVREQSRAPYQDTYSHTMAPQPGMPNGDARTVAYSETLDALGKIKDRLDKSSAELDLPMLCVVGDQTSGKSSLLEALTGVSFPVKSGTCTRMPIVVRCRTADDEPGTTVTLREPDGSERVLPEGGVAKGISKAQDRATKEAKCGFVTNGLRLEARGSGQMELILVDLPGLIHNGDDVEKVGRPPDPPAPHALITRHMQHSAARGCVGGRRAGAEHGRVVHREAAVTALACGRGEAGLRARSGDYACEAPRPPRRAHAARAEQVRQLRLARIAGGCRAALTALMSQHAAPPRLTSRVR